MKHLPAGTRLAAFLLALSAPVLAKEFRHWKPSDTSAIPKTLSATGLYEDIAAGRLIASAIPYEVNTEGWHDGAVMKRWFLLRPGKSIGFKEKDDYWDYPDSTVFVQQYAFDTVPGDTATRVLWETRMLILDKHSPLPWSPSEKEERWYGFSYKWRADRKDADLVPDTGLKAALRFWPEGRDRPARHKKWVFPKRERCAICHQDGGASAHGRTLLGFFTAQLNRPSATSPGRNQLADFFARGLLSGTLPADLGKSPRWYGLDHPEGGKDPEVTAEMKARAYIAANCSGCHGARGMALGASFGVDLDFDYHTGVPAMRLEYAPVSWSHGMDTIPPIAWTPEEARLWGIYQVTPRFPRKSLILHRLKARNAEPPGSVSAFDMARLQMPPLGSYEVDTAAVKVMERWIEDIPSRANPTGIPEGPHAAAVPVLNGRNLYLPPALRTENPAVRLRGLDGRLHSLRPAGPGRFAIPPEVPRGVYVLQVGPHTFTRSVW